MRVDVKLHWLHTASTSSHTFLNIHARRGTEAMDAMGVLLQFQGVAVHDGWQSYFGYACAHALCNAHLLRELTGIHEDTDQEWADAMRTLLGEMKDTKQRYVDQDTKRLSPYYRKRFTSKYDALLEQGFALNPLPDREPGQKGPVKRSPARKLLDRLDRYRHEVFRIALDFRVPFDNNQSERDIRIAKVKQKVSGGFRSDDGAKDFAIIQSFLQTAHKQWYRLLWASLVRTISGGPVFDAVGVAVP